jgi:hypothetical protein
MFQLVCIKMPVADKNSKGRDMIYRIRCVFGLSLALLAISASNAIAAVSDEEAKQLGTTLLPWGAEKAGNKDGTIPAFTGDRVQAPASYCLLYTSDAADDTR